MQLESTRMTEVVIKVFCMTYEAHWFEIVRRGGVTPPNDINMFVFLGYLQISSSETHRIISYDGASCYHICTLIYHFTLVFPPSVP